MSSSSSPLTRSNTPMSNNPVCDREEIILSRGVSLEGCVESRKHQVATDLQEKLRSSTGKETNGFLARAKLIREALIRERSRKLEKRGDLTLMRLQKIPVPVADPTVVDLSSSEYSFKANKCPNDPNSDQAEMPSLRLRTPIPITEKLVNEMTNDQTSKLMVTSDACCQRSKKVADGSTNDLYMERLQRRRSELVQINKLVTGRLMSISQSLRGDDERVLISLLPLRPKLDCHLFDEKEDKLKENGKSSLGQTSNEILDTVEDKALEKIQQAEYLDWSIVMPEQQKGKYCGPALEGILPHGFGTLIFTNGDTYSGPFEYGVCQGSSATYTTRGGVTYKGDFWHNLKHGRGEEYHPSGRRYIGRFKAGNPHGFGIQYNSDGSVLHFGLWCEGIPVSRRLNKKTQSENPVVLAEDISDEGKSSLSSVYDPRR